MKTTMDTPYYLDPEITENRLYYSTSDIWSYVARRDEVVAWKDPFVADLLIILASEILKDQFPDPDASWMVYPKARVHKPPLCRHISSRGREEAGSGSMMCMSWSAIDMLSFGALPAPEEHSRTAT